MAKKSIENLIENLAVSTENQFREQREHMDKRFEHVDKRFDQIENRFDKIEFLITGHEQRLSTLEDKVRQISVKVGLR